MSLKGAGVPLLACTSSMPLSCRKGPAEFRCCEGWLCFSHCSDSGQHCSVQEFGLTPVMWQLADLAHWLDPLIQVYTVVHNPKAGPSTEERGLIRALSQVSQRMIVMTW